MDEDKKGTPQYKSRFIMRIKSWKHIFDTIQHEFWRILRITRISYARLLTS
jgi:hypothetical protein